MNIFRNFFVPSSNLKVLSSDRFGLFFSAFTRPFPLKGICFSSLSTDYQLSRDGISYSPANLSRCVPCDFGPTAEKHIYHLLFFISFPALKRIYDWDCLDGTISSYQIHFDEYLHTLPSYNLLSTKDFSNSMKVSLHRIQKYSYVPQILRVQDSSIGCDHNPFPDEPFVDLVKYFDSLSHCFLNTSQDNNNSFNFHKQTGRDMNSRTYADIVIREVDGLLRTCDRSSRVFQVFHLLVPVLV